MTTSRRHHRWFRRTAITACFLYCMFFLVNSPGWFPVALRHALQRSRTTIFDALSRSIAAIYEGAVSSEAAMATYLLLFAGALPLVLSRIAGRRPADVGWNSPNRLAFRYFLVALCISTPFLWWMAQSPTIAKPYLTQLHRLGFLVFVGYYMINMFTEHLLLHGVILGLTRPDGRWAPPADFPPTGQGPRRTLRWLGMAMPDANNLTQWLGLAPGCLFPMVFSALLFGLVHLGKDSRELILAFPGGLAQAYIAYRSNSWLTPFAIHLATASMALGMMIITK